jgi:hypothetical protein
MKEAFEPVMPTFTSFLVYALQKYNESSLVKAGLYCVSSIVSAIGYNFHKYSDEIINILIELLTNTEVSRYNKTTTITLLGEISINICEHFLKHLDNVMELLLSACEMAMASADFDDDETEEYLKELRLELIEAFTFISFCLDDCQQKPQFAKYVPRIFNYFKAIVGDNYQQKPVFII